ncbi:MAG: hypothetical protein U0Q16_22550 [Bryobacteraceae bacterium]
MTTQISAPVSGSTRDLLERYCRESGVKKGHLIEQALLYHLQALQTLPDDVIIRPRIVVSKQSGLEILKRLEEPPQPTPALRKLMKPSGD